MGNKKISLYFLLIQINTYTKREFKKIVLKSISAKSTSKHK